MTRLEIELLAKIVDLCFDNSLDNQTFDPQQRDQWLIKAVEMRRRLIKLIGREISQGADSKVVEANAQLKVISQKLQDKQESLRQFVKTIQDITDIVIILDIIIGLAVASSRVLGSDKTLSKQANGILVGPRFVSSREASVKRNAAGIIVQQARIAETVRTLLAEKFSPDPGIRYGDGYYYLPTLTEVQQILNASQLDRRTWLAERFDCDDFAYVLKGEMSLHAYDTGELQFGLSVGIVWGNFDWVSGYHAINWFVASDMRLHLIEPQTDSIYEADRCQGNISLLLL